MSTINGIGTKYYGISNPDDKGVISATYWFTFVYLPIFPMWRAKLIREVTQPHTFNVELIKKQSLQIKEVLLTYLFGWLITPLIWFGLAILCIREIADYIGLPSAKYKGMANREGFGLYEGLILFSIVYIIVFAWKWKDWDEKRGLPKNYKEYLKRKKQSIAKI